MHSHHYFIKSLLSTINPTYFICSFLLAFSPVVIFIFLAVYGYIPVWVVPIFWASKAAFDVLLFAFFMYGFHMMNRIPQSHTSIRLFKPILTASFIPAGMAAFIVILGFIQTSISTDTHTHTLYEFITLAFKTQSNLYMIVFSVLIFSGQWLGLHYFISTDASLSDAVERGYKLTRSDLSLVLFPFLIMSLLLASTLWIPHVSVFLPALLPAISYAIFDTAIVGGRTL